MTHTTKITKDANGNTVHVYRGIEIELNAHVASGYYGRYSYYFKTRKGTSSLATAKREIDALFNV